MSQAERIIHQAEEKLQGSSHRFRNTVHCRFDKGTLTVAGRVPSFYLKQTAQALLADIDGVERVENEVLVVNPTGVSSEPAAMAN